MSAVLEDTQTEMGRWVTFRLADETYGINVMQVQEVLRLSEVAPVPGAPPFVMGIINLRGTVVTVVDMRKLMALPAVEASDSSRIMIIESGDVTIGLLVDGVAEVVNIDRSGVEAPPSVGSDESARYIIGVHSSDEQILILIDLDKLLSEEDRDVLEQL